MSHSYLHPHNTPKRSLPSDFPPSNLQEKVVVLAKVNMVVTILPVICFTIVLLLFYFRLDVVQEYAKNNNDTFLGESLYQFTSKERDTQWQTVFLQFAWCVFEAIMGYVLLHGAKLRDYGYMKAWLLIMTVTFLAEVYMQGTLLSAAAHPSDLPIVLLVLFIATDLYRFTCLFIVYLLIDEMLERGEVKRDTGRGSNFDLDE